MGQGQSSSLTGKMTIQALVEKAEDVFLPVNDEIPRPLQIGEDVFVLELVYFVGDYDAGGGRRTHGGGRVVRRTV